MTIDQTIAGIAQEQLAAITFINPEQQAIVTDLVAQLEYSHLIEVLNDYAVCKMQLEAMKRPATHMPDEQVEDFFDYLTGGDSNSGVHTENTMTPQQAFAAIYWLQEGEFQVIPDKWELCNECHGLVNTNCEGTTVEEDDTDEEVKPGTPAGTYHDDCFLRYWNSPY